MIALSANAVKGKAALQIAREIGVQTKTAWANLMKIREALAARREGLVLDGAVEIDGMYLGGHVRPENRKEDRVDRRKAQNQSPNGLACRAVWLHRMRVAPPSYDHRDAIAACKRQVMRLPPSPARFTAAGLFCFSGLAMPHGTEGPLASEFPFMELIHQDFGASHRLDLQGAGKRCGVLGTHSRP